MRLRYTLLGAAVLAGGLTPNAYALDILLTNDDGYEAPGINIMYQVLTAAGHNVTLVAPKENQSGTGASINTDVGAPVEAVNYAPQMWYVDGTPTDSVNFAFDIVLDNAPDLVVSGSNFGENVGVFVNSSGTVSAAVKGLQRGIPAIAVSVGIDLELIQQDPQAGAMKTINAMDDAATFTAKIIGKLQAVGTQPNPWYCRYLPHLCPSGNGIGLPAGVALNINYPAEDAVNVKGVVFAELGTWEPFHLRFIDTGGGNYILGASGGDSPEPSQLQDDAVKLSQGYAVVSVIDGSWQANTAKQLSTELLLEHLTP